MVSPSDYAEAIETLNSHLYEREDPEDELQKYYQMESDLADLLRRVQMDIRMTEDWVNNHGDCR